MAPPPPRQRPHIENTLASRHAIGPEIAPGLRRWTARHEEVDESVASLAVETVDGLVLIDPLDPPASIGVPRTSS